MNGLAVMSREILKISVPKNYKIMQTDSRNIAKFSTQKLCVLIMINQKRQWRESKNRTVWKSPSLFWARSRSRFRPRSWYLYADSCSSVLSRKKQHDI